MEASNHGSVATALLKQLLTGLNTTGVDDAHNLEDLQITCLELIMETLQLYGGEIQDLHGSLLQALLPFLEKESSTCRKRAVSTIGALVRYLSDDLFKSLADHVVKEMNVKMKEVSF